MNESNTKQTLDILRWVNHEQNKANDAFEECRERYYQSMESITLLLTEISKILKENMDV